MTNPEGRRIKVRHATAYVYRITKVKNTEHYQIECRGHSVLKTLWFRSDEEKWDVDSFQSHNKVVGTSHLRTETRNSKLQCPDIDEVVLQYLDIFFRCDGTHQNPKLPAPVNYCTTAKNNSSSVDEYTMGSFACVSNNTEFGGHLFFGERTLFKYTDFCKDHDVKIFFNIPNHQKPIGILNDLRVNDLCDPAKGAGMVMNDFRQLGRYLYPSIATYKWNSMAELKQLNVRMLLHTLTKDAKAVAAMNIGIGCQNGRTRSPTVAMFFIIQIQIAMVLVASVSDKKTIQEQAKMELDVMAADTSTKKLAAIRDDMNSALARRAEAAADSTDTFIGAMSVDRDDRCVPYAPY